MPADKIDVIPPGVDLDLFRPSELPQRSARVRVLFVGGQFERKGGLELLEAARALGDKVELGLVTGSEIVNIPAGVFATVYRGLKPQSEMLVNLYRSADIFVLPSRGDCMPQAVAEALASGLPVVATSVGAIGEMVAENVNGHLVQPRDVRALAAAIGAMVDSPARRREMGRSSLAIAHQYHDAVRNNGRILELLKRLAAKPVGAAQTA
jgi:glycosyltransferase involved in cell wall biosynthesis